MKKYLGLVLGSCVSLTLLSVSSVSSAAPQNVGSKCVKAGTFRTAKNLRYQCEKFANGLRWVITPTKSTTTTTNGVTETTTKTPMNTVVVTTTTNAVTATTTKTPMNTVVVTTTTNAVTATTTKTPMNTVVVTTTVPLTCATGGICVLGDVGPGGGKVFYVHPEDGIFSSADSDCKTICKYLEAAPVLWSTEKQIPEQALCKYPAKSRLNSHTEPTCIWSANTTGEIGSAAQGRGIGAGSTNTSAIISDNNSPVTAASVSRAYRGGNKTDWHLASVDEMAEFAESNLFDSQGREYCWPTNNKNCVKIFRFSYWTSTENPLKTLNPNLAIFCSGDIDSLLKIFPQAHPLCGLDGNTCCFTKDNGTSVRPIRAF